LVEDFESLLGAARAGQGWAWEAIYRELSPSVLGYLRARGAAEPDDLTAEVFLQLVRDLERFTGGEREFRAWVFTVAHHRLLDERRRQRRRPVEPVPTDAIEDEGIGGNVEEEALSRIEEHRLLHLLGRLSGDQRSVLLLRIIGDLTVEQVALVLGKTPGAVKALQRRGLAAIRREISRLSVTP
jgi:RNA polymerase sigma-70 factor (ECF subfamily)